MRYTATPVLLLLLLAGCAPPPVAVRGQGTFFVYAAYQDPQKAARCIVLNTGRQWPGLIVTERPARDAYTWEVVVGDGVGIVATARTDIAAILVSVVPSNAADNEKFVNALVRGC